MDMVELHNMLLQRSSVLQLRSNWLDIVKSSQNQPSPSTQAASARHSRGGISSQSVELRPEWHQAFAGLQRDKCFCQELGGEGSWGGLLRSKKGNKSRQKTNKKKLKHKANKVLWWFIHGPLLSSQKRRLDSFPIGCLAEGQKK